MKAITAVLLSLFILGCTTPVHKYTTFEAESEDAMILVSLYAGEKNTTIGDAFEVHFVGTNGQTGTSLKVDRGRVVELVEKGGLKEQFTGVDIPVVFSEKSFYLLKAKPGHYALKQTINHQPRGKRTLCLLKNSFEFEVKAGQINYIGDFELIQHTTTNFHKLKKIGISGGLSKEHVKTYEKITAPLRQVGTQPIVIRQNC